MVIKYNATIAKGKIYKLSIKSPISVSTLIFFLTALYRAQLNATIIPTQGSYFKLKKIIKKIEMKTNKIEKNLFLLSFSLKKIYPNNTLKIGIMK